MVPNPMLIGEIKKYLEKALPKINEEIEKDLLDREEEVLRKIERMTLDPEAQERARLFLEILKDEKCKVDAETRKLIVFALYYLIKKQDLIPDWYPIVGYDDDVEVTNYIYRETVTEIEKYKECAGKK